MVSRPGLELTAWELSVGKLSSGGCPIVRNCPVGVVLVRNCPGGESFWFGIDRVGVIGWEIVQRGLSYSEALSGDWELTGWELSGGGIVQWGCSDTSFSKGLLDSIRRN